jgi:hypothetical protein
LISKLIPTYFKGVKKKKKLVGRRSVDEEYRTSEKPSESRSQPSTSLFCFFTVLPIYLRIVSCFKAKHWVLFFLGFNQILDVFLTKDEFQSHRYINNVKENMNTLG